MFNLQSQVYAAAHNAGLFLFDRPFPLSSSGINPGCLSSTANSLQRRQPLSDPGCPNTSVPPELARSTSNLQSFLQGTPLSTDLEVIDLPNPAYSSRPHPAVVSTTSDPNRTSNKAPRSNSSSIPDAITNAENAWGLMSSGELRGALAGPYAAFATPGRVYKPWEMNQRIRDGKHQICTCETPLKLLC